jgi:hypothetical protein
LAAAALLSACGGGAESDATAADGARDFVAQIERKHPMSAAEREALQDITVSQVDAKALFDWAEFKLPSLFPKGPQNLPGVIPYLGNTYTVRAYPNGNFLGLRQDGAVFALGPFTGNALQQFGRLADYAAAVVAEQCQVNPASCAPSNEPTGPVNECAMPAATALTTGNRGILTYISYTTNRAAPNSEFTLDGTVIGASAFEGQSAVRLDTSMRGTSTEFGVSGTVVGTTKSYSQAAQNGLILELGGETENNFSGGGQSFQSRAKYVINAGGLNSEFALQMGQSFTKLVTITTTIFTPLPSGPTTGSTSETITFEGKETVSVLAGTFNTCRYRSVDSSGTATVTWYIVGRGISAKSQTTVSGQVQTEELKSGTFNGGPL